MQVELQTGIHLGASLAAISAAAGFVMMTWGESGYRVERIAPSQQFPGGVLMGIAYADGSRFTVESDRWGNVEEVLS